MCPPKTSDAFKIRERARRMCRKRGRKIIYGPYDCPFCGQDLLIIRVKHDEKAAVANCTCGFRRTLDYSPSLEPVDYYNRIIDSLYHEIK